MQLRSRRDRVVALSLSGALLGLALLFFSSAYGQGRRHSTTAGVSPPSSAAWTKPPPALRTDFYTGRDLFRKTWTSLEGLGPMVNAQACVACHGESVADDDASAQSNLVLLSPSSSHRNDSAVFQRFLVLPNKPVVQRPLPRQVAHRRPPPLFGLGLLEAVSSDSLTGRFGWTGRFHTIDEAVEAAFANELGLVGPHSAHAVSGDAGGPEISAEQIRLVSHFIRLLAPPRPIREPRSGERHVFERAGCASCHQPVLRSGRSPIAAINNQVFDAYTDLKLHDLGPALRDPWAHEGEEGSVFRTPPLWGLGTVGAPYLHDGRAVTLDGAIRLHSGEAAVSATAYQQLSKHDRELLLSFLRTR